VLLLCQTMQLFTSQFVPMLPPGESLSVEHTVLYTFSIASRFRGQLCAHVISSTKLEVHNAVYHHHQRTKPWSVWTDVLRVTQADGQTNRQTPVTHMFTPKWNEPYLPFLQSCIVSLHFGRYSFSIPLRVEG